MKVREEVLPFLIVGVAMGFVVVLACKWSGISWNAAGIAGLSVAIVMNGYFAYFFRDPERTSPSDRDAIVAAADGTTALIVDVREDKYLKCDTVRISIFLSLFDVHVNRAPLAGKSKFLGYFPGKRLFTFQPKSSEVNQHNAILITGERTRCLVKQIVGPVARRVVYWPDHDNEVELEMGARIGMMKFGSRLDMYFPKGDIEVLTRVGDKVVAGETVIARLVRK